MRDIVIVAIVLIGSIAAIRRPWIGVMVWTWLSIMNPHRYAWGFAFGAPLAAMAAASTLLGLLFTRERESPMKGSPVVLLVLLMLWITLSWLLGIDPAGDYSEWDRVMKVDLMILVALALLRTKEHIVALAWVATMSVALLGAKGGFFTLLTGGGNRVWGPTGSFIGDNNHFAVAVIMAIPLVRFLQMQLTSGRAKLAMTALMVLMGAAGLGSQSRGGLIAVAAMTLMMWWRGRSRFVSGLFIALVAVMLVGFMPDSWTARMSSTTDYQTDTSALGRINAWWVAWNVALNYPTGAGFLVARPELFAKYSLYPEMATAAAHSIYFQILGNHGFVGLVFFVLLWASSWRLATRIRKEVKNIPEARWCTDLAAMCQVSLIGYLSGGAFLSLAYFDLPYNVMVLLVLTHAWVKRRGWATDPPPRATGRWRIPGVAPAVAASSTAAPAR